MCLRILLLLISQLTIAIPSWAGEGLPGERQFEWQDENWQDEQERPHRVAILFDCSSSMELQVRAGETRRDRALVALSGLLAKLPQNTELLCVGFNDRCTFSKKIQPPLGPKNRAQAFCFARSLIPRGDTLPADCVASVLQRHPNLDDVFLVTDARATSRRVGIRQAHALAELQSRYGVTLFWVIVDPPSMRALAELLRLTGGRMSVAR